MGVCGFDVINLSVVAYTQGPLSMLKRAVEERRRIKVWTRSFRYVRGICTGYVVMFDKHFNLVSN